MTQRRIGVVIAQYGQWDLTLNCLATLQRHHAPTVAQIVLVDDGSPQAECRRQLQMQATGCEVLVLPQNQGVTAAWNVGSRLLLHDPAVDVLVFLNNDVTTLGPWLERLSYPIRFGGAKMSGVTWRQERRLPLSVLQQLPTQRFLTGWCFAVQRAAFLELGGFDPRLQLYFSDTDLQCRLLQQNLSPKNDPLWVVDELAVRHGGHRTTRQVVDRSAQWERDQRRFVSKWSPVSARG